MLNFFLTKNYPIEHGIKVFPQFDYIKRRYKIEIDKVISYLNSRNRAIENTNIFSRTISILSHDVFTDSITFLKYVEANARYIARTLGYTNTISQGKVFRDILYRNDNYVVLDAVESNINVFELKHNWRQCSPIRVIYSNITDLDYYIFDKSKSLPYLSKAVLQVDIPLMCMMYYYWCQYRMANDGSTNSNVFVYQYLLPSIIRSNIDICIFNRLRAHFYDLPVRDFQIDLPIYVYDLTDKIDNLLFHLLNFIDKTPLFLEQLLRDIPTIMNKDGIETLYINKPYLTRRSLWSLWFSRIKYINFLLDLLGERGRYRNKLYINKLPLKIKALENRNTDILMILPYELQTEFLNDIEELKQKVGRR